jgi:type IV fimbrial biogenesis protein FimT
MVELLVGVAIIGILAAIAAPALSNWVLNAQIRAAADAIQNGLQLARGEAVRLNTLMRFQLTTSTDNTCQLSKTKSNWVVSQHDPTGLCASAPAFNDNFAGDPLIVQIRSSAEGSGSSNVTAGQSVIAFNGLGRQVSVTNNENDENDDNNNILTTPNPPAAVTISVTNPTGGTCIAAGGPMKCLNVVVSSYGQIHMCDPSLSLANNPNGC